MLTKAFDFYVNPVYFPGYEVSGKVMARVWYEVGEEKLVVTKIGLPFSSLKAICINEPLIAEIEQAAYNDNVK